MVNMFVRKGYLIKNDRNELKNRKVLVMDKW